MGKQKLWRREAALWDKIDGDAGFGYTHHGRSHKVGYFQAPAWLVMHNMLTRLMRTAGQYIPKEKANE
jgi:hypothetical protein